jgi:hypothetical protein
VADSSSEPVVPPFGSLTRGPWATAVYGTSREVANRVLYTLASQNDPDFVWVDIRNSKTSKEAGPAEMKWIPAGRLYLTNTSDDAKPGKGVSTEAIRNVVRSNNPAEEIAPLANFLRLSELTQQIVAQRSEPRNPRVVAFANSERVRDAYPTSPEGVREFLHAFLRAGVHPMFSLVGPRGVVNDSGRALDFIFVAEAEDASRWNEGALICVQAPAWTAFRPGQRMALGDLPKGGSP